MQQTTAPHTGCTADSPTPSTAVCKTRTNLLDQLADVLANLGHVKLELTGAQENGDTLLYESARFEVGRLRSESNNIRFALEQHRSQHRC